MSNLRVLLSYLNDEDAGYDLEEIKMLLEMCDRPITNIEYFELELDYWFGRSKETYSIQYRATKILELIS